MASGTVEPDWELAGSRVDAPWTIDSMCLCYASGPPRGRPGRAASTPARQAAPDVSFDVMTHRQW
jgi:hypothetical protein